MAPRIKHLLGGFAVAAAAICALPIIADSFAAVAVAPAFQINRAVKSDRLMVPNMTVAKRKAPVETVRQNQRREEASKPKLLDGCEPSFSSVTTPSMAHISGRCVG